MLAHTAARVLRALRVPVIDISPDHVRDSKWHQDLILHLASIFRPKLYVEVGIHHCGLFNRMVPFASRLIGVDANPDSAKYMMRSAKAEFVCATSTDYARRLRDQPLSIDMLFIDADHSEAAVESDFTGFFDFVAPHGLILLHDTHPLDERATSQERCGDGYKAITRLAAQTGQYEMMTLPKHPGLTLCRKRTKQLSWQERGA